jgi:hypothetical protein
MVTAHASPAASHAAVYRVLPFEINCQIGSRSARTKRRMAVLSISDHTDLAYASFPRAHRDTLAADKSLGIQSRPLKSGEQHD